MIDAIRLFDPYSRQARLYPALLVLFPAIVLALSFVPSLVNARLSVQVIALAVSCGVVFLLADISRAAGKKAEKRLLSLWGGWPTTILLRHSSDHLNAVSKARYHTFLAANVPGLQLPTLASEEDDPFGADEAFASAVHWLKERCRGQAFSLLLRENATYGFRRNMLGLKAVGLTVSVMSLTIAILALALGAAKLTDAQSQMLSATSPLGLWITLAASSAALCVWIFVVNDTWVRSAADTYAGSLLACCDHLTVEKEATV